MRPRAALSSKPRSSLRSVMRPAFDRKSLSLLWRQGGGKATEAIPFGCPAALVRENVLFAPACQVQAGARREEAEAGVGEIRPAFAGEPDDQLLTELMQVGHVRCGVGKLRVRQRVRR